MTDFHVGFWRKRAVKAALDRHEDRDQSWRGHRIVKFPGDCLAMHRLLHRCAPEVVVEIGTQNGGSALWFAECAPQVVTIDIAEVAGRPADPRIAYLTGDSASPAVFERVKALAGGKRCSVVIDGDHRAPQVAKELELYAPLVGAGQALILEDTHVDVLDFRKFRAEGGPLRAVQAWLPRHPEFSLAEGIEPYLTTNFFGYWVRR